MPRTKKQPNADKKYKKERDALAHLLGQLHCKVKAFKTTLETGDLATSSKKHLSSDTGGGEDTDKDRRIRELEEEVAMLREREK